MTLDAAVPVDKDFVQEILLAADSFVGVLDNQVAGSFLVELVAPPALVSLLVPGIGMACVVSCLVNFESHLISISLVVPEDSEMAVALVDYYDLTYIYPSFTHEYML